jgi:CDP-glycerol glycerophosphotransferase (TagB/SpsB family)
VRLVYKPHPLTGTRHRPMNEIHKRLVELIRAAGGDVDARTMDGPEHRVVTGRTPSLFDCFNDSDMLISDVSSVVADYVQSQRPYVMANPADLPEDEFRRRYPTARAAYLLSRDVGELEKVVNLARSGDDPMVEARRELKTYLLGPDEPSSLERFQAETTRLVALARP